MAPCSGQSQPGKQQGMVHRSCLVTGQLLATFAILLCYAHNRLPTCWAARPGFLAHQNVTDQNVTAQSCKWLLYEDSPFLLFSSVQETCPAPGRCVSPVILF